MKFGKQDKGVAGLTILLSLVTMLFVIGLIIMIFALMGGELADASYDTTTVTVTNESGATINGTVYTVDNSGALDFASFGITTAYNITSGEVIASGNYTVGTTGTITNATATVWTAVNLTYTYSYSASNDATDVIGNTTNSISSVTDWYDIFIVIGAMVVLILLTVIIITAIRGSGLMESGSA